VLVVTIRHECDRRRIETTGIEGTGETLKRPNQLRSHRYGRSPPTPPSPIAKRRFGPSLICFVVVYGDSVAKAGQLRWGVLGVANIAVKRAIAGIQAASNGCITAIASRDLHRAQIVAQRFGIPAVFGAYEEMLRYGDIDAVYLPLPHHLHRKWTLIAAEAGKHVLCEKPLALSVKDAVDMAACCASAGVLLMEAFMYRFHPSWVEICRFVGEGGIGELRAVHTEFAYFLDDADSFRSRPELGGGALYDVGCYAVSVSRLLFGREPVRVAATMLRHPSNRTDIVTSGLLDFGIGHATFTVGTQLQRGQSVHITGAKARIDIETPFNIPSDAPTRVRVIRGGSPGVDPEVESLVFGPADPYTLEAEAFARAIVDDRQIAVPPSDSIANLEVIERIAKEAKSP
jgi:predicted dehydrogenase